MFPTEIAYKSDSLIFWNQISQWSCVQPSYFNSK